MIQINKKLYIIDKSYLQENWQDEIKNMPLWRQKVIDKFTVNEPKKLSLIASILFEKAIREMDAKTDINNIKISYNQFGKPYIDDEKYKNIKFNISHTKDKAILVVSDEEVGCDIEMTHDIDLNIAKRFFIKNEYNYIESLKDIEKKKKVFYKMWTMKESFGKYTGKGLSIGLDSVDFSDIDFDRIFNKQNEICSFFNNGEMLYFHNFDMKEYMITVCTKNDKKINIVNIL